MNIFEQATKNKLRFQTTKGSISVEDLWDLPLTSPRGTSLDSMAIALDQSLRTKGVSFVDTTVAVANAADQLRFEIIKHVIGVRMKAKDTAEKAKATRQRNDQIRRLIADKENDVLAGKSIEELQDMLE